MHDDDTLLMWFKASASLCYLYNIDIFQYTNTKKKYPTFTKQYIYMYKTKYALHHSRIYANVYIGIGSTCIHKGLLNNSAFNKVRVESVEYRTTDLMAVGSNPTVDKNVSFCILSLSTRTWQVDWSHTNEIKRDAHPRYIGA